MYRKGNSHPLIATLTLAVPEQRRELGISRSQLARLSGVSRSTVSKLERGGRVDEALIIRLAITLTVVELYGSPASPFLERQVALWLTPDLLGDAA